MVPSVCGNCVLDTKQCGLIPLRLGQVQLGQPLREQVFIETYGASEDL